RCSKGGNQESRAAGEENRPSVRTVGCAGYPSPRASRIDVEKLSGSEVSGLAVMWLVVRTTLLLTLDALVNFFAVHGNVLGCVDADSHLVPLHTEDGDGDVVTDHHGLAHPSGQYKHSFSSLVLRRPGLESRKAVSKSTDSHTRDKPGKP